MAQEIPGINQSDLIATVRNAAEGRGRVSKQQLFAATYLLNKLLPNAGRDADAEETGNTDYREIRIRIIRDDPGGVGPGVQSESPASPGNGEPEAV